MATCANFASPSRHASRGLGLHALKSNCRWLSDPRFLLESEGQWLAKRIGSIPEDNNEVQVQETVMMIDHGSSLDQLRRRCSSWSRLLTLFAWLFRFLDHIQNKVSKKGTISLSEIRSSSKKIPRLVQRQVFSEEIDSLSEGSPYNWPSQPSSCAHRGSLARGRKNPSGSYYIRGCLTNATSERSSSFFLNRTLLA